MLERAAYAAASEDQGPVGDINFPAKKSTTNLFNSGNSMDDEPSLLEQIQQRMMSQNNVGQNVGSTGIAPSSINSSKVPIAIGGATKYSYI